MSARAENRYKVFAANKASEGQPSINEMFLRDLNALPKRTNAQRPFGDIHFVSSHGGWFAECPTTGFGYFYRTLREAVTAWRVAVFLDNNILVGQSA